MADVASQRPVVIAGGSGFLGLSLASSLLAAQRPVVLLSRHPPRVSGPWKHVSWDGRTLGPWSAELDGAAALVNLAGRSVNCIKTPDHCDEIWRSRVESTRALGRALLTVDRPPPVWIQMSTAHLYGDPPEVICTEESPFGVGLAPTVGQAWEAEFAARLLPQQRGVVLRTSFVIGRNRGAGGGALQTLSRLARWGLGGAVGSGRQGMSWLHELDFNRIVASAIDDANLQGAYIASSPHPVAQREFMRSLRKVLRMPVGLPAPAWLVRIGAKMVLRTDPELALYGRYVHPSRLLHAGFQFAFPELSAALRDLLR